MRNGTRYHSSASIIYARLHQSFILTNLTVSGCITVRCSAYSYLQYIWGAAWNKGCMSEVKKIWGGAAERIEAKSSGITCKMEFYSEF